jgi:hypothetical protein
LNPAELGCDLGDLVAVEELAFEPDVLVVHQL